MCVCKNTNGFIERNIYYPTMNTISTQLSFFFEDINLIYIIVYRSMAMHIVSKYIHALLTKSLITFYDLILENNLRLPIGVGENLVLTKVSSFSIHFFKCQYLSQIESLYFYFSVVRLIQQYLKENNLHHTLQVKGITDANMF